MHVLGKLLVVMDWSKPVWWVRLLQPYIFVATPSLVSSSTWDHHLLVDHMCTLDMASTVLFSHFHVASLQSKQASLYSLDTKVT